MSQPEALYRLQETDLNILRSQQRLSEIDHLLANDAVIQAANARLEAAHNTLNPLKSRLRSLEHDIVTNESKTRTTEQQLYSGAVKNPKEMQDMQQEIDSLKRWHGELENSLLETMLLVEEAEQQLQQAEADLAQVSAERGQEHKHLLEEQATLQAQLELFQQRRTQVLTEIAPENVKTYNSMKVRKHNQPVAVMHGNTCSFCGVAQTMAIEREVRQGVRLVLCSNCERILVPA